MMHGDKDLDQLLEPKKYLTRGFGGESRVKAARDLRKLVDAAVDVVVASLAIRKLNSNQPPFAERQGTDAHSGRQAAGRRTHDALAV